MTLGEIIKTYRKAHGMSMEGFSKASGLSKAYVGILERNVNPTTGRAVVPSIVTYKAAAMAMGMDMQQLIEAVDGNSQISLAPVDELDWELANKEIEDDINNKIAYVRQALSELVNPLSDLSREDIDRLLKQFRDQVDLYHSILERETRSE